MQQNTGSCIIGSVGPHDLENDKELVARAQKDPLAFGAIFDLYYKQILTYTLRRTADARLAEDITADTFAKALHSLWRYSWRGVPLSAWLYKIAGNEIRMQARKRASVSLDILVEAGFDIADDALSEEREALEQAATADAQFAQVSAALRSLPQKYQEVLALRYMEDKSGREIALIVNKKESTVRSLLHRGMQMLKAELAVQQKREASITTNEGRGPLSILQNHL